VPPVISNEAWGGGKLGGGSETVGGAFGDTGGAGARVGEIDDAEQFRPAEAATAFGIGVMKTG